jgi:hypothetical protein
MTDLTMASARALRLMLAALDDRAEWGIDAAAQVLLEVDACSGCRTDLILILVDLALAPIGCSQHRELWRQQLEAQLVEVLDTLGAPQLRE